MFKKFAFTAIVAMFLCGPAFAQTNPGYKNITATTSGVYLPLNLNPTVEPTVTRTFSILSTDGEFTVSFWDYDNGAWKAVAFKGQLATSDTLSVKMNVIWPGKLKCDGLFIKGVGSTSDVDVYWYQ